MTKDKLFAGLFPVPYKHGKWLSDQAVLIERLKVTGDEFLKEQAKILETHQKSNQCSIVMMDLMADRVERHLNPPEKKDLTTKEEAVINSV